jgi:hypothetical protein
MAIQISCPSCRSEAAVDDSLAGKDVLCPHCQARITVPSLAAGAPEERRAPVWDDSAYTEREALPRYRGVDDRGADDFMSSRHSTAAWGTTATGLALMFWSGIFLTVLTTINNLATMFVGNNPQPFGMGGGGAPQPEMIAFAMWGIVAGCGMFILAVVSFVGMCMCCTAPSESGAKGKAITGVVAAVLYVVAVIVALVVSMVVAFNPIRQGGGPLQPEQVSGAILIMAAVAGVGGVIVVALWMLFHKAVADHFQYPGLARASVLFIIAFIGFTLIAQTLNVIANPQMLEGNPLAPPPNPALAIVSQVWGLLGMVALSVWFLVIVRETRRTILGTNEQDRDLTYSQ